MVTPAFKVFVSAPSDYWLNDDQRSVKHKILDMLKADGFEVELMGEMGMPFTQEQVWTQERADKIVRCCQGMAIIGMPRWHDAVALVGGQDGQVDTQAHLITEYTHCEGSLGYAHQLPILRIIEDGVTSRGILHHSETLTGIPVGVKGNWLTSSQRFMKNYDLWKNRVSSRYHVFFGYSGGAIGTAAQITNFLTGQGVRVRDWKDFATTGTILKQIQDADETCLGGIFLFTKDDTLESNSGPLQVPRDNVIFEAGYFVSSKGEERVQIIREEGTKLLADLTGQIYIPLKDRNDITPIQMRLLDFVKNRLSVTD